MRREGENGLYALMTRLPVRIGYAGKIFLAAFLPAQIPVVTLIVLTRVQAQPLEVVIGVVASVALCAALMGWGIYSLLRPMRIARRKLHTFVELRHVASERSKFADSADVLVTDVERVVTYVDESLRRLELASNLDSLTGIPNRRFCGPRLEQDLARSRRDGVPVTLAFVDLDCLKNINDEHGHLAGDVCLQHIAGTITDAVRIGDWIARWGGDEFVVCLWNTDKYKAEIVCHRILTALRSETVTFEGREISLSASAGICQADLEDDATTLMRKADSALMTAKRSGRDQLALF